MFSNRLNLKFIFTRAAEWTALGLTFFYFAAQFLMGGLFPAFEAAGLSKSAHLFLNRGFLFGGFLGLLKFAIFLCLTLGLSLFLWKKNFFKDFFNKNKIVVFFKERLAFSVILTLVLGIAARFWATSVGHNFDMDSNVIIGSIMSRGGNVYAETTRYNYGPVWFNILGFLYAISRHQFTIFKYLVAGFNIFADLCIFLLILKKYGKGLAALFFLNPISIMISGYAAQVDSFAILIALAGILIFGNNFEARLTKNKYLGLLVLGLSLAAKHIFFAFPLWLAVKQKGLKEKAIVLFLPVLVFFAAFLPYWHKGKAGIISNVLLYKSLGGMPLLRLLKLAVGEKFGGIFALLLFFFALAVFAWYFRKRDAWESALLYTLVLLVFSSSIATNYLTQPVVAITVFVNLFFLWYTLFGAAFLFSFLLMLPWLRALLPSNYSFIMVFLILGFAWLAFPQMPYFLLEFNAKSISKFKRKRGFLKFWNKAMVFLRRLKIPVYKDIFDTLTFRSYYAVLKEILLYKKGGNYFEWGPGLNTEMARKNMNKVFSVEHDKRWHEQYERRFPVIFSPISGTSCLNYPLEIQRVGENIDVAFVDGRCRTECIRACREAGVKIVVMHDTVMPFFSGLATDSAPPAGHEAIFYYQGYPNYKYYIEAVDFRTIVLVNTEEDYNDIIKLLGKYYLQAGLCRDYPNDINRARGEN